MKEDNHEQQRVLRLAEDFARRAFESGLTIDEGASNVPSDHLQAYREAYARLIADVDAARQPILGPSSPQTKGSAYIFFSNSSITLHIAFLIVFAALVPFSGKDAPTAGLAIPIFLLAQLCCWLAVIVGPGPKQELTAAQLRRYRWDKRLTWLPWVCYIALVVFGPQ